MQVENEYDLNMTGQYAQGGKNRCWIILCQHEIGWAYYVFISVWFNFGEEKDEFAHCLNLQLESTWHNVELMEKEKNEGRFKDREHVLNETREEKITIKQTNNNNKMLYGDGWEKV